jgi:ketosteroid isomerase-like protein
MCKWSAGRGQDYSAYSGAFFLKLYLPLEKTELQSRTSRPNKMQKLISLLLLTPIIASAARAAKPDAAAEIRAVMSAQVAAWNRGDIDGYMDGYVRSDKLEFVSAGKITRGWQTVRDRYHRKYDSREKMGRLAFSDIKVTSLTANTALVQGRWSLRRKSDQPHGSFVLVFRHTSSGWRIVQDETS